MCVVDDSFPLKWEELLTVDMTLVHKWKYTKFQYLPHGNKAWQKMRAENFHDIVCF